MTKLKRQQQKRTADEWYEDLPADLRKAMTLAKEKGASSWLIHHCPSRNTDLNFTKVLSMPLLLSDMDGNPKGCQAHAYVENLTM